LGLPLLKIERRIIPRAATPALFLAPNQ